MQGILRTRLRLLAREDEPGLVGALGLQPAKGRHRGAHHGGLRGRHHGEEADDTHDPRPPRQLPAVAPAIALRTGIHDPALVIAALIRRSSRAYGPRKKSAAVALRFVARSMMRKLSGTAAVGGRC